MTKFKIGDKVNLREDIDVDELDECGVTLEDIEEVESLSYVTILNIFPDRSLDIELDEDPLKLSWSSDWFKYADLLPEELFKM